MDLKIKKELDSKPDVNKAFYSNVVGSCVSILDDYISSGSDSVNLEGFEWYYISTEGIAPLVKAINIVMSNGYSLEVATEYVRVRVFEQTFRGVEMELKAMEYLKSKGKDCRRATRKEDFDYAIDLIGDNFAIQVKPSSYKGNNPSLDKDKLIHFNKQREYEKLTKKKVFYMFYDNNKQLNKPQVYNEL